MGKLNDITLSLVFSARFWLWLWWNFAILSRELYILNGKYDVIRTSIYELLLKMIAM